MQPATLTMCPWGPVQKSEEIADGVLLVSTAEHGGLHLLPESAKAIPRKVGESFLHGPGWPETDAEMPIAITLLIPTRPPTTACPTSSRTTGKR